MPTQAWRLAKIYFKDQTSKTSSNHTVPVNKDKTLSLKQWVVSLQSPTTNYADLHTSSKSKWLDKKKQCSVDQLILIITWTEENMPDLEIKQD